MECLGPGGSSGPRCHPITELPTAFDVRVEKRRVPTATLCQDARAFFLLAGHLHEFELMLPVWEQLHRSARDALVTSGLDNQELPDLVNDGSKNRGQSLTPEAVWCYTIRPRSSRTQGRGCGGA
jgi:hypothetical protein